MDEKSDVAVFIDFENIYISVHNKYGTEPNFESIMERCNDYGRVIIARAYADWYRYPRVTSALYANGIEPMYVPTYYYDREDSQSNKAIKNSVDIHLCIEAMKTLYNYPNIATYIFVSGDRDFIPLVNNVRQHGKRVVVIGIGGAASSHLAQSADEFVLYKQLIDKEPVEEPSKDPYKALVDAVYLARSRGNVCTLASLKLLMMEIMGGFDEKEYKDSQGRPFTKFKDFVVEAERRGLVQIFTSGTVNEVFLPGEDPYELSHFASKPPSEEEEKEETEEMTGIGQREWQVFVEAMHRFDEPALFVQIYNSLRGLRNQEVIDLSNSQIKEMIKIAIKNGLLIRSSRGAHRYYALNPEQPLPK